MPTSLKDLIWFLGVFLMSFALGYAVGFADAVPGIYGLI